MTVSVSPVASAADRHAFVDLPWTLYAGDPNWRPPLKDEVHALIGGPKRNPWFLHARAAFFLARRDGRVVGRISAQVCDLVQERRPGLGQWGRRGCCACAASRLCASTTPARCACTPPVG